MSASKKTPIARDDLDPISSSYYNAGGYVSHDVIKAKMTPEQYQGWHLGVVLSYLMRFNFKHVNDPEEQIREIEKCIVHLNWMKTSLEENIGVELSE